MINPIKSKERVEIIKLPIAKSIDRWSSVPRPPSTAAQHKDERKKRDSRGKEAMISPTNNNNLINIVGERISTKIVGDGATSVPCSGERVRKWKERERSVG